MNDELNPLANKIATITSYYRRTEGIQMSEEIDRTRFEEILQVGHNRVFQRIA